MIRKAPITKHSESPKTNSYREYKEGEIGFIISISRINNKTIYAVY